MAVVLVAVAVAATLREIDQRSQEQTGTLFHELLNAHQNAFVDEAYPYRLHLNLSPMDQATVMTLQRRLSEYAKSDEFDLLIP